MRKIYSLHAGKDQYAIFYNKAENFKFNIPLKEIHSTEENLSGLGKLSIYVFEIPSEAATPGLE